MSSGSNVCVLTAIARTPCVGSKVDIINAARGVNKGQAPVDWFK